MFLAFFMVLSLIFCFDSPSMMTRIKLVTDWILCWGLIIYVLHKLKIL